MAGAIGGDAVAGFGFADNLSDRGGMGGEGRGRAEEDVGQHELRVDEGTAGALLRDDGEAGGDVPEGHAGHGHGAMVFAITAAAGGQLRFIGSGDEQRRNQRKAEDKQQQRGWGASHEVHSNNKQGTPGKRLCG